MGYKVYISVDMEGITGIVHSDQLNSQGRDYERGRRLMTGDANAAIAGAFDAGATEVVVGDGHGPMRNLLIDEIDSRCRLVTGAGISKPMCQLEGVDDSFDAAFFVGYHARASASPAVAHHTLMGAAISEVRLDGRVSGETGINASVLGALGVPVVMVSGDQTLAAEAREWLGEVELVVVKQALGRRAAICLPPGATAPMLREAASRALKNLAGKTPSRLDTPITMETEYLNAEMAEVAEAFEFVERIGPKTIRLRGDDMVQIYRRWWRVCQVAGSTTGNVGWLL
jgi:D-amino peptidase